MTGLTFATAVGGVDGESALGGRLDKALREPALAGARIGGLVVRASDGEALWSRDSEAMLIPASNMKILIALAALEIFGPSHRFTTHIMSDRRLGPDGAVGEIGVRGGGDPVTNSEDWWRLAADLRRSGLRSVQGDLVVDDSAFDGEFWHPSWSDVSARAYHAPVGALTANYGAYFARVGPGSELGQPAKVDLDPPVDYLRLVNQAQTVDAGERTRLTVGRGAGPPDQEQVLVSGRVRLGDEATLVPRSVADPALYAGSVLKWHLQAMGVTVAGRVRRGKADWPVELLRFDGRPLSEIVFLLMKYSNNAMAETLVKAMGANSAGGVGSWQNGLPALEQALGGLGLLREGAVFVDGSGLSPDDRISASMLVAALRRARASFRIGPELVSSLPIAGRDGTLEERLLAGMDRIRAKTGLLVDARVLALSGIAQRGS
ncbi:MAG: D-alanyl-D-alanine carboxypeptidase/D-alanyl-D-alanine-endopeptidase, partial [Myxococcota bacterium]